MGKKFEKGNSGRPKGARNKSTILFENILENSKADLLNKAIELAQNGEVSVLNKLLDKIAPSLSHTKNDNVNDIKDFEDKLNAVLNKAKELTQ